METASWLTPGFIRRLDALQLSVASVRAGRALGGRFPVNRRGSSIEFADYAPYVAGDDIRTIDWSLYARLERLFVRTYKEEVTLSVELILDATDSMRLPTARKFERAGRLAVSLGYIALAGGHHVRATCIAPGRVAASPRFHRRGDLFRLAASIAAVQVGGAVSLADWMRRAAPALRFRSGQAIVLTDGMIRPPEFFHALHLLVRRHMEVKVIQVLTPEELHPGRMMQAGVLIDAETGQAHHLAYRASVLEQAMAEHNALLAQFCARAGILFVRHRCDEPLDAFLTKTLPARGFLE